MKSLYSMLRHIAPGEAVLGFPAHILPAIVKHLEFLAGKAIPNSRKKGTFAAIKTATCPSCDPVKGN
jgi:hypothetical protein